jgi:hypothetical protein
MHHSPCLELDDEKSKERSKEEIGHLQEVTGPDLCRVVVQERRPVLPSWLWCTNGLHVLLDGALAHMNIELKSITADTLSTEDGDSSSPSP